MTKSYYQRREDEVKILIAKAKVRNNLTDAQLAKKIGMPHSTFGKQKLHPGTMRLEYVWAIEKMAGGREEATINVDNP